MKKTKQCEKHLKPNFIYLRRVNKGQVVPYIHVMFKEWDMIFTRDSSPGGFKTKYSNN